MICIMAIPRKTPPLKAFAMPKTSGDSLKDLDFTGNIPKPAASMKATIINNIFKVFGSMLFYRKEYYKIYI